MNNLSLAIEAGVHLIEIFIGTIPLVNSHLQPTAEELIFGRIGR